jgi:hypothetical protein
MTMRNELKSLILASAVLGVGGCGDSGSGDETTTTTPTTVPTSLTNEPPPTTDSTPTEGSTESNGMTETAEGTNSMSASNSNSNSNSDPNPTDDSDSGFKTDVAAQPDFGKPQVCGMGMGGDEPDFSYIWIANSAQNTISKIDTQTLVELGRYLVRPDGQGSPSRTSVNLSGDVVTASRSGGFSKFYARQEDCVESNGVPGIQTSTDANFLAWDQEECRAWHTPMAYQSQRPAAWTQGTFNMQTCKYENQKAWTSGNNLQNGTVDVLLVNGDNGAIEQTIQVSGIMADFYGIYGAAVDKDGNFWGSQLGQGYLVNINLQTLQVKTWPMATSGYGMTVDSTGFVWTCSGAAARFDPMTETWQTANVGGSGGCMEDGKGTLYMSGGGGNIVAVDTQTMAVKTTYPVPQYVHGISIDFYGYVWGVSMGSEAYRVDPANGQFLTFTGLVGAYSYSDMTGFALSNVGGGPQG